MLNSVHSETVVEAIAHLTEVLKMTKPREEWVEAKLKWALSTLVGYSVFYIFCQALLGRRNDKPKDRYSRLDQEIEKSNQSFIMDQQQQQEVTEI